MLENTAMCPSLIRAKQNRWIVAEHLFTIGHIQQEILRQHWETGAPKPARLIVDEGELPEALPRHYHPFASWRETDGRGRKSIMRGWLGTASLSLDVTLNCLDTSRESKTARISKRQLSIKVESRTTIEFAGACNFVLEV